jgi:hypothetical protein
MSRPHAVFGYQPTSPRDHAAALEQGTTLDVDNNNYMTASRRHVLSRFGGLPAVYSAAHGDTVYGYPATTDQYGGTYRHHWHDVTAPDYHVTCSGTGGRLKYFYLFINVT